MIVRGDTSIDLQYSRRLCGRAVTVVAQGPNTGFSYKDSGLFQNTCTANVLMVAMEVIWGGGATR